VAMAAPESVWQRILNMKNLTSVETIGDADSSAEQRYTIWQVAGKIITAHPVLGVGLGAYPQEHSRAAARSSKFFFARGERDTHSMYLNVLAETGIIGISLLLGMLASMVIGFMRLERILRRRPDMTQWFRVATTLKAGLIGFLVCALFGGLHREPYLYLYIMLMAHFALLARATAGGTEPVRQRVPVGPILRSGARVA
jgi:putative inorganic carbon (HCO3(-)) transporter